MLDEMAEIRTGRDLPHGADLVAERAGELGLLDATHLAAAPDSDITTAELIGHWYREEIFEPAARYRGIALDELAGQLAADEEFCLRMRFITGMDRFPRTSRPGSGRRGASPVFSSGPGDWTARLT